MTIENVVNANQITITFNDYHLLQLSSPTIIVYYHHFYVQKLLTTAKGEVSPKFYH